MQTTMSEYDKQAADFLAKYGIKFRATLSDTKTAEWDDGKTGQRHHYRITLSKPGAGVSFDFFGSVADYKAGRKEATPYDVLACLSSDANTPETFEEFCSEYGYNADSRKDYATFRRCDRLARRLRAFFTAEELAGLNEIQ